MIYPHVAVDLETYGVSPGSVILSIGLCEFAVALNGEPQIGSQYYAPLNFDAQCILGQTVDNDTVAWWSKQTAAARQCITDSTACKISLAESLEEINTFMMSRADGSRATLWGNGSDFDNVLLISLFRAAQIKPIWSFSKHRCHRTLMAVSAYTGRHHKVAVPREGTHHNALDDAVHQAKMASRALESLGALR